MLNKPPCVLPIRGISLPVTVRSDGLELGEHEVEELSEVVILLGIELAEGLVFRNSQMAEATPGWRFVRSPMLKEGRYCWEIPRSQSSPSKQLRFVFRP